MKKSIDEEAIRQYYELLDQRETEIRVFEPTPHSVFVHDADGFIGACKRYNGRCNVYAGINERRKNGTKDKDVIKLRVFYFDVDPQRPKNTSATDTQKDKALKLTMKIAEHLDMQGYKHITIGDSGNGYHIYLRLKPIDVNEKNWEQVKKRWKAFGDGVREKFGGKYECNVDPVFNLSRISKVLGTLSVKGKVRRLSQFIQFDSEVNEGLREDILTISEHSNPPNAPPTKAQPPNEERFNELLRKDEKLRELYEGKIAGYPSRSEAEQALVCKLVWYEFPDEQIKEIMQTARIGKWQESKEQYRDLTLRKARQKYVTETMSSSGESRAPDFVNKKGESVFTLGLREGYVLRAEVVYNSTTKDVEWHYQVFNDGVPASMITRNRYALNINNQSRDANICKEMEDAGFENAKELLTNARREFLKVPNDKIIDLERYVLDTRGMSTKKEYNNFTKGEVEELSKDAQEKAEKVRQSGKILYHIKEDLESYHIGETEEVMTAFLGNISALTPNPLMLIVEGKSSAGKTHLVRSTLQGIPKQFIKDMGSMSPTVLQHTDWDANKDVKILFVREASVMNGAVENFKLISNDDGGFTACWVEGSPNTGFEVKEVDIPVKSVVTTSAKPIFDEEYKNRTLTISSDESKEQTERVFDREADTSSGVHRENDLSWLKAYLQDLNEFDKIYIPFAKALKDLMDLSDVKARRDAKKLFSLIGAGALLHQHERPQAEIDSEKVLFAVPEDAYYIFELSIRSFGETTTGLTKGDAKILETIAEDKGADWTYTDLLARLKQKHLKITRPTLRKRCEKLADLNLVVMEKEGTNKTSPFRIRFNEDCGTRNDSFGDYNIRIHEEFARVMCEHYPDVEVNLRSKCYNPITGEEYTLADENSLKACKSGFQAIFKQIYKLNELSQQDANSEKSVACKKSYGGTQGGYIPTPPDEGLKQRSPDTNNYIGGKSVSDPAGEECEETASDEGRVFLSQFEKMRIAYSAVCQEAKKYSTNYASKLFIKDRMIEQGIDQDDAERLLRRLKLKGEIQEVVEGCFRPLKGEPLSYEDYGCGVR